MTQLTKKDVEILNLKAARMSTASIAMMTGWSEAKVYNRLTDLRVFSAADALERLAGGSAFSLAGLSAFAAPEFGLLLSAMAAAVAEAVHRAPLPPAREVPLVAPARPAPTPARVPRAPPKPRAEARSAVQPSTDRAAMAAHRPRSVAPMPTSKPLSSPRGALRLRPVSQRVAVWAGHFRRASWPLAEVADLFDVAEDDLALALGEAA
ncbi:hypothetical protein [Caulobacter sp. BP25]|uniref:hypothetical protein n=1 Tax=Caulobacter sp. BP25 TaxID=2048900 RepID=UPI000C13B940|nr:hypothetical protein [Caulobacter sp. BP25]PHY20914.1 hypothetical protein CSW59_06800 [Caulobacter sp. BP25]